MGGILECGTREALVVVDSNASRRLCLKPTRDHFQVWISNAYAGLTNLGFPTSLFFFFSVSIQRTRRSTSEGHESHDMVPLAQVRRPGRGCPTRTLFGLSGSCSSTTTHGTKVLSKSEVRILRDMWLHIPTFNCSAT